MHIQMQGMRPQVVLLLIVASTVLHGHRFSGNLPKGERGLSGVKERERTPGEAAGQAAAEFTVPIVPRINKRANPTEKYDHAGEPIADDISTSNELTATALRGYRIKRQAKTGQKGMGRVKRRKGMSGESLDQDASAAPATANPNDESAQPPEEPLVPYYSTFEDLANAIKNAEADKTLKETELNETVDEITGLKDTIDSACVNLTTATAVIAENKPEADKFFKAWKEPDSVTNPAQDDVNTAREAHELAKETYADQPDTKALEAAIKTYDETISTWEEFEEKVPHLDNKLIALNDQIATLQCGIGPKTVIDQCKRDLNKTKATHDQLKKIGELRKANMPAAEALRGAATNLLAANTKLDNAIKYTTNAKEGYERVDKVLEEANEAAAQANQTIIEAESKLPGLEDKKKIADAEVGRLTKQIAELKLQKKTLTTPAATTTSEDISGSTDKSAVKDPVATTNNNFVGSVGFWILIGLFASAVLFGVVGMGLYFGCRKKKNAKLSPRAAEKPKIATPNVEKRGEVRLPEEVQVGTPADESDTTTTQSTINGSTGDQFSTSGTINDSESDTTGSEHFAAASFTVGPIGGVSGR